VKYTGARIPLKDVETGNVGTIGMQFPGTPFWMVAFDGKGKCRVDAGQLTPLQNQEEGPVQQLRPANGFLAGIRQAAGNVKLNKRNNVKDADRRGKKPPKKLSLMEAIRARKPLNKIPNPGEKPVVPPAAEDNAIVDYMLNYRALVDPHPESEDSESKTSWDDSE